AVPILAQSGPAKTNDTAATARAEKLLRESAAQFLALSAASYRGRWQMTMPKVEGEESSMGGDFDGGFRGDVQFTTIDGVATVSHGGQALVRAADGTYHKPDGDRPDHVLHPQRLAAAI